MYRSGQIYYIKNFKQGDKSLPKNRYCIILTIKEPDLAIVFHKVTRKTYCDPQGLKPKGNIINTNIELFKFPKGEVIGKKGFYFDDDSYVHMGVWNISDFSLEKFESLESEYIDDLKDEWLNDLLYFIYKSDHIKQKYARLLEPELERLN